MANEVRIKKVKAYPFPVTFKIGAETLQGHVVKLTQTGFLAEVPQTTNLKTGEKFDCAFELPVMAKAVSEACVLVKIYTAWAGGLPGMGTDKAEALVANAVSASGAPAVSAAKTVSLLEVHFQQPSPTTKQHVTAFLNQIGRSK